MGLLVLSAGFLAVLEGGHVGQAFGLAHPGVLTPVGVSACRARGVRARGRPCGCPSEPHPSMLFVLVDVRPSDVLNGP